MRNIPVVIPVGTDCGRAGNDAGISQVDPGHCCMTDGSRSTVSHSSQRLTVCCKPFSLNLRLTRRKMCRTIARTDIRSHGHIPVWTMVAVSCGHLWTKKMPLMRASLFSRTGIIPDKALSRKMRTHILTVLSRNK